MLFPEQEFHVGSFRRSFLQKLLFPFTNGNHLNLDGMDIKQNDPSFELQKTYFWRRKKQLQAAFSIQESNATSEEEQAVSEELMGPRMPKV